MLKEVLQNRKFKKAFRKANPDNSIEPVNNFDMSLVKVGKGTYGNLYVLNFSKDKKLEIGNFCSVAPGVIFAVAADHDYKHLSTFPFKVKMNGEEVEATSKGNIIIKDDVWIGANAIILSGVTIGQGALIGAGAVVTKDVPPYAIVGCNPAKVIKYRFSEKVIKKLLEFDFSKLDEKKIKENLEALYKNITDENVDDVLKALK